jgi:hypothetical protein
MQEPSSDATDPPALTSANETVDPQNWKTAPVWYHIIALLLILPAAWIGGELRVGQLKGGK